MNYARKSAGILAIVGGLSLLVILQAVMQLPESLTGAQDDYLTLNGFPNTIDVHE